MAKKNSGKNSAKKQIKGPHSGGSGTNSHGPMDIPLLEQITRMMRDNDLNTVDVRDGDRRIILKRGAPVASGGQMFTMAPQQMMMPSNSSGTSSAPSTGGAAQAADANAGQVPIKSPMVGTFYAASSPDAKPFVSVGSTVDEESDVCIIEAMKVFNNIKAEMRGTIQKILVTSGETVEFGQPLFLVKPS